MKNENKVLGHRVKFLRMDKGVSQTKMAELLGLSQTNLSNMERGRTAITIQNLFKIKDILDCKMADFFIDFDGELEQEQEAVVDNQAIELEEAVKILRLLKLVDIKGL